AGRTSVQRSMDNGSSIWTALTQSSYGASWRAVAVDSARRPRPAHVIAKVTGKRLCRVWSHRENSWTLATLSRCLAHRKISPAILKFGAAKWGRTIREGKITVE